jgi:gentisate 1,2-dioxygenase
MLETMGMAFVEDAGDADVATLAPRPPFSPGIDGADPYAERLRRLAADQEARRSGRLHTSWDSLEMLITPRGTRTTFLLDRAIGYQASGISMAMFEIGPGRGQSMHRHPGEAWLYVVEGRGHSYLGAEPEGGKSYPWKKGDIIVVDHFLWHQHINDDPDNTVASCGSTCSTVCWRRCARCATRRSCSKSRQTTSATSRPGTPARSTGRS